MTMFDMLRKIVFPCCLESAAFKIATEFLVTDAMPRSDVSGEIRTQSEPFRTQIAFPRLRMCLQVLARVSELELYTK